MFNHLLLFEMFSLQIGVPLQRIGRCGHVACRVCLEQVNFCPICRGRIDRRRLRQVFI